MRRPRIPRRRGTARELAALRVAAHETRDLLAPLADELNAFRAEVEAMRADVRQLTEADEARHRGLLEILQLIYDDEPGNRRRLHALRRSDDYDAAFSESEPLVSVIIPTYTNFPALRDRAIPSVLEQTYRNFELVIVGETSPPETAEVVAAFGDARIRFQRRALRGPYPEDHVALWNVASGPPFNDAIGLARGRWIAPFADDDALRPNHLERLVAEAQAGRHEVVYGCFEIHWNDGRSEVVGDWPPRLHKFAWQAAIYHAGLSRFVQHELGDALFGQPSDWSLARRMVRLGVRFHHVDEVFADYYPSYRGVA
jgi:hypothetical protein